MTQNKPEDVLGKLPKTTPAWAVGTVSIIVALATSFATVYLLGKSEVQKWVEGSVKTAGLKTQVEGQTLQTVLGLIRDNSQQITLLSVALAKTQEQNFKLTERVSVIEKELTGTQTALVTCQLALKKCGK